MRIPRRLDEILPAAAMEKFLDVLQQPDISGRVREALHRVGLQDNSPLDKAKTAWQQARSWLDTLVDGASNTASGQVTLNARGQLLSHEMPEIPLTPAVAYGFATAATHYQIAADVDAKADAAVEHLLGRHASAWLISAADALRMLASAEGCRGGVVLSRVDAVRIIGLGDVHAMLSAGAVPLREIGASNGVSAEDWQAALTGPGQIVVLSSPNSLTRDEAQVHRNQAIAAARAAGAKVVEILADGAVSPELCDTYGFPDVRQRLDQGADVVVWPLHLLAGGPSGALVVGDAELISAVRRRAEATGVLLGGARLVASTVALQRGSLSQEAATGALAQLLANPENLRNRARRTAVQLTHMGEIGQATECEIQSPLGPSPWNRYRLQSWGVRLLPKNSLEDLKRQLARGEAKLGCRLQAIYEDNAILLNLRFIAPEQDHELVQVLSGGNDVGQSEVSQGDASQGVASQAVASQGVASQGVASQPSGGQSPGSLSG